MPSEQIGSAYAEIGFKVDESGLNSAKSKFSSAIGEIEGKAKSAGAAIGGALKTGLEAGAVALAGVATVGVKTFMDIESAAADAASKMDLSEIAQKSGTTTAEAFKGVKEHVMALADELGQLNTNAFDPTQIAAACANLAAGGFDVASASAADLQDVLALATATGYDLSDSAGLAMSTMNQFGMTVSDLGHISDVYALAAGKSAASMTDFDYAMQQAGPVAKGVGMSYEELTARISKLADAGYSGEKSGTALRTAMMSLTSITKPQGEALERLGITYDQVNPKTHSFSETLDLLVSKGADIYDFGEIFGKEGAAIIYSTAQQQAGVKQLTAELQNCNGAASDMAKNMLDTLKGDLDAATGAASSLAYAVGKDLAPSLRGALQWFSAEGAPAIREFYEAAKSGDWKSVGDMISSGVKAGWSKLKDLGSQLLGWLKGVNWGGAGDFIVTGIKAAWNELMSLGGQLLDSLEAVDWGSVGSAIWSGIEAIGQWWVDFWQGLYDDVVSIDWGGVWDALVDAFNSAIEGLSNIGETILGYFDAIDWGLVGSNIGDAIRHAIETLADIGQTVYDYLISVDWSGAGSSITDSIRSGLEKLNEFWTEFKAGLSSVDFATAGTEIGNKLKEGLKKITTWASDIIAGIKSNWQSWINDGGPKNLGRDLAEAIVKGASDLGKWIYDNIKGYFTPSNGATLRSTISSAIDFAKMALTTASDFVTGFANTILTAGKGTIGAAILEIIGNAMNSAWEGAGDSLISQAKEWRKDAEDVLTAKDFEADLGVVTSYLGGSDPSSLDGKKYTSYLDVVTTTTGEDITAAIKSIQGTTGASGTGTASGYWSQGNYWLTSKSGGVLATDTAEQMGKAGAQWNDVYAVLKQAQTSGATLTADDVEKIKAAFTEGKAVYDEAHKTAGEDFKDDVNEAGDDLKEDAEEIGDELKSDTDDAGEGFKEDVKDAGKETKDAALTFRQQIWKTVSDVDQIYRNTHEAVKIGLTDAGQSIAIIGEVAQKKWEESGNKWADGTQLATDDWIAGVKITNQDVAATFKASSLNIDTTTAAFKTGIKSSIGDLATVVKSSATTFGNVMDATGTSLKIDTTTAFTNAKIKVDSMASGLVTKGVSAGNAIQTGGVLGGNALRSGASAVTSASSALGGAASAINSASSNLRSVIYSLSGYVLPYGFAEGTVTKGPQMAMIGEDGAAYPEFVIPTKKKRWDLLYAALKAYGIRGFAEGGSTGEASAGAAEPEAMAAYFSITGLASMSKQVQRIISNLKDFFRITWGIIKAEGAVYWNQINTVVTSEVTSFRDSAWQAILDVRNTAISSFQEILAGAKDAFAQMWPEVSGSVQDLSDGLVSSLEDASSGVQDAVNQMITNANSSLTGWSSSWNDIWENMLTELATAQETIATACSEIAAELSAINVNVNINASGSGGSSSSGGSDSSGSIYSDVSDMMGEDHDFKINADGTASFVHTTLTGDVLTNALKYTSPNGVVSYINPLTGKTIQTVTPKTTTNTVKSGSSSGYSGGSSSYYSGYGSGSNYVSYTPSGLSYGNSVGSPSYGYGTVTQWGSYYFAKGALVEKPTEAIIGEAGPELVLPSYLTEMFLSLAEAGLGGGDLFLLDQDGLPKVGGNKRVAEDDQDNYHTTGARDQIISVLKTMLVGQSVEGGEASQEKEDLFLLDQDGNPITKNQNSSVISDISTAISQMVIQRIQNVAPDIVMPVVERTSSILSELQQTIGSQSIENRTVVEDHTVHHWYMDGKEVTNLVMKQATKQLRLKGAASPR